MASSSSSSYARIPSNTNSNASTATSSYQQAAPPMCVISSLDDIIAYIEISTVFPENFNKSNVIDIAITDNLASGRQLELLDNIIGLSVSGIHMSLLMDHFAPKGFIPIGFQQRHGYRIIRFTRQCNKNNPQQPHHQQRQQQVSTVSAAALPPAAAPPQQVQLQAQLHPTQPPFFQQSFLPAPAGGNEANNPFYR